MPMEQETVTDKKQKDIGSVYACTAGLFSKENNFAEFTKHM